MPITSTFQLGQNALSVNLLPSGPLTLPASGGVTLTAVVQNFLGCMPGVTYVWSYQFNDSTTDITLTDDVTTLSESGETFIAYNPGTYFVTVSYQGQTATSNAVIVTQHYPPLTVSLFPTTSQAINPGGSVLLTACTSGGDGHYTYQWYLEGKAIENATSAEFVATQAGEYSVLVNDTSVDMTVNSTNSVKVTVNPLTVEILPPTGATVPVTLTAVLTNYEGDESDVSYTWTGPGSQSGAGKTFFAQTAGTYTVAVTYTGADYTYDYTSNVISTSVTLDAAPSTVVPLTVSLFPTTSQTINPGGSVLLTACASGGDGHYTYQWVLNGNAIAGNANSAEFLATQPGEYSVLVNDTSANMTFEPPSVKVSVNDWNIQIFPPINSSTSFPLTLTAVVLNYEGDPKLLKFEWTYGNTTVHIPNLYVNQAGKYSLTVYYNEAPINEESIIVTIKKAL